MEIPINDLSINKQCWRLQIQVAHWSHLQQFFDTVALTPADWILAGCISAILTGIMLDISTLGSVTLVATISAVFFLIFYMTRDYWGILQLALASIGAGFLDLVFQNFIERPRPSVVTQLVSVNGFSIPSGHSFAAAALYLLFNNGRPAH